MFESLGDLIAFGLLGLQPDTACGEALHFFVMDVTKIFVLLVVVIYIMGLLRAMLSPELCEPFQQARSANR